MEVKQNAERRGQQSPMLGLLDQCGEGFIVAGVDHQPGDDGGRNAELQQLDQPGLQRASSVHFEPGGKRRLAMSRQRVVIAMITVKAHEMCRQLDLTRAEHGSPGRMGRGLGKGGACIATPAWAGAWASRP